MIEFNSKIWKVNDPDRILEVERGEFDAKKLKYLGNYHPREDFINFENIGSKIIVDFGYYGCEVKLDGFWQAYVVDGNLEEGWHSPLECHKFPFSEFKKGVDCVQSLLAKYT
jgi:hypothetical protein